MVDCREPEVVAAINWIMENPFGTDTRQSLSFHNISLFFNVFVLGQSSKLLSIVLDCKQWKLPHIKYNIFANLEVNRSNPVLKLGSSSLYCSE
jgi:hypothetical protein